MLLVLFSPKISKGLGARSMESRLEARARFSPLPLGTIEPSGWLKNQLNLQASGLSGFLPEIFNDVGQGSGWLGGEGENWERGPYYVDGLLPLAVLTKNSRLYEYADRFIQWSLNSQDKSGFFGPQENPDWWPRMVMLKPLTLYGDLDQSGKVEEFLTNYFKYQLNNLDGQPLYRWARARGFENLVSLFWLYEKTNASWLLELAEKIREQTLDWSEYFLNPPYKTNTKHYLDFKKVNWEYMDRDDPDAKKVFKTFMYTHVVNVAMALKAPWYFYRLTKSTKDLKAALNGYEAIMEYHGTANYLFTGDEHLAGLNPSQGTELCAVVELMYSLENLLSQTGVSKYGDFLEKIAYNALPAAISPDFWSHQYDQQTNQISCTIGKRDWTNNDIDANIFGLEPNYGCCTANFHQGWPKFTLSLWLKAEDGIVLSLYAPSTVSFVAPSGEKVVIAMDTEYPFNDKVKLKFKLNQPAQFKLYFRQLAGASFILKLNGEEVTEVFNENGFLSLLRTWKPQDELVIQWMIEPCLRRFANDSLSVERGPLVFALPLGERWVKVRGITPSADYELSPQKSWQWGMLENTAFEVEHQKLTLQPFNSDSPPIIVKASGAMVENWPEENLSAGKIPKPQLTKRELKELELIPYGAAKLRIAQFPIIISKR